MTEMGIWTAGQWTIGHGPELTSTSPTNGETVWVGQQAGVQDVDSAMNAARNALPAWSDLSFDQRCDYANQFAETMKQRVDELALLIARETGKPLWESKTEAGAVVGKVQLSIDAYRQRRATESSVFADGHAFTRFKPHGVMGVLGPFNFPAHLPNGHIVPALLAGNTVVFKPSEQTPAVGQFLCQVWEAVGLPPGVMNLVQGGRETGEAVVKHAELDGLLFTGSFKVGQRLNRMLADQPHKLLALEMGGNNPLIVHQAADLRAAAYLTILSAYITAGQRCSCARRLILVDGHQCQRLLTILKHWLPRLEVSTYDKTPEPFMGTVISKESAEQMLNHQAALIADGGQVLVEMTRPDPECAALLSPGLIDITECKNVSDDEWFGPLLQVIRVDSFERAIEVANDTAFGLAAGIITDEEALYKQFWNASRAGIINWNRQTTGASGKMPFGGTGQSGNHRPSGFYAADYCSYPVASIEATNIGMPEKLLTGIPPVG